LSKVVKDLKEDFVKLGENWKEVREKRIKPILYRPFDVRWTYFFDKSRSFVAYPRYEVMKHFVLGENVGFVLPKLSIYDSDFSIYVLVTDKPADKHTLLASKAVVNRSITVVIPLYRYEEDNKELKKVPNIKPEFLKLLKEKYNATPEDFLYYAYAVLHDPKYRKRYAEFLKIDFPRIPLYDKETFDKYKQIGKELVELHLMKKEIPIDLAGKIKGESLKVEKVKYDNKGVWINNKTILLGIPEDVWNYKVGGYQVIEKYLKSRKGRELSLDELEHIYRVVEIIKRTIELVKELEKINPSWGE
jgi:predicted helicase